MPALLDIVAKDSTNYSATVRVVDATDGTPETGVAFNTAGVDLWYRRPGSAHTSITEVTQTEAGAHTDGGFVHISDGYCRLDLPDAAVATGVEYVDVGGTFTGMVVIGGRIRLTDVDLSDGVRGGMTALPNFAAGAAGGLPDDTDANGRVRVVSGTSAGEVSLSSGEVTPTTASKTGYRLSAAGVDDVWDETSADHLTAGSTGAAVGGQIMVAGTVQTGGNYSTTVELPSAAVADDDYYNNMLIEVIGGTGVGQSQYISDYVGGTQIATINGTFATTLDATSIIQVRSGGTIPGASAPTAADNADAVWDELMSGHIGEGSFGSMFQSMHDGTLQAATASTATLDATGSSTTDDFYQYGFIKIVSGTGVGQPARQISAYNGTSKVATIALDWTTTPDNTSQYVLTGDFGIDAATVASIADGVWDEARAGHVAAGSFGEYVIADSTRVSGSSTAADLLEAATTGGTPLPANVTQVGGAAQDLPTATNMQVIDDNVDSILTDTGTTIPNQITALNDPSVSDILTTSMTEAYAADGAEFTVAQALYAVHQRLFDADVSGTTLTVRQLDGTTAAMTLTLDNGSTPTDVNRTG